MSFNNFVMNLSYPKKIVNSSIENEFFDRFTNFGYKKVNILMGANATGKTSFGKMLMNIFISWIKSNILELPDLFPIKRKRGSLLY